MKNILIVLIAVMAGFSSHSYACTASAVPASPASSNRTVTSGSGSVSWAVTIMIDCADGETYAIKPTTSNFAGRIGTTTYFAQSIFYKDAGFAQPMFTNPINGTSVNVTGGMANSNTQSITVYGLTKGSTGIFSGLGSYSLPMSLTVTSSGGAPFTINYTESGTVEGTCTIGNASVSFTNVVAGQKPIKPITVGVNCTAGLPYSISQPTLSQVTIGTTTKNSAWIYSDASGTVPLNSTPLSGTGIGGTQNKSLYVGLSGPTMTDPIAGVGSISGTATIVVTY